jgi:UPF0755 protein
MKKLMKFLLLIVLLGASLTAYGIYYYDTKGPLTEQTTVVLPRGQGFQSIVSNLANQRVVAKPLLFRLISVATGNARRFKAGEYQFPAGSSPHEVMTMLAEGRVLMHKVTIPEGWTSQQVMALLDAEQALSGEVKQHVAEGSLLPDTYQFLRDDKREMLIAHMQSAMGQQLAQLWEKRAPNLPFATPQQAVTLASIVEKETGVDSERGRVAAVFINRLRRGMRLQSDPTVAYGIDPSGKRGRPLTTTDLHTETPYNTYTIDGLPPGPIANPGKAALMAVLNPPQTDELYFVATGNGGHNFSSSLEQHNSFVQQYRKTQR